MAVTLSSKAERPDDRPKRITVLGSTGSIGRNTLDLVARAPDRFRVCALTAWNNVDILVEQARQFEPEFVAIGDEEKFDTLQDRLGESGIELAAGTDALVAAAELEVDWIMSAIVGAAGLEPTLAAVRQGAVVALANKECLVCAGQLILDEVRTHGSTLLPVDSEHNAIFQVYDFENPDSVERLILTASGGPFRTRSPDAMGDITPEQACDHPNWSMGAKISVDSATMMNKGLEVIEAHHLFGLPDSQIEVLVHPQSVVHSLVAYKDGSVLAQLGTPDMRTPISFTLAWPERMASPSQRLDLAALGRLDFEPPDPQRFPALRLAREALRSGGGAPVVLNAANEVAVDAFLQRRIGYLHIAEIVAYCLDRAPQSSVTSLADVRDIDAGARRLAAGRVDSRSQ